MLEGYPEWAESKKIGDKKWDKPRKGIWFQLRSYLVAENDYEKIKDWAIRQDFMDRWMPESSSRYEVFSREYYWSPAYNYFIKEYFEGIELRKIQDKLTDEFICHALLTTNNFLWEEEFDNSKEGVIHFLKPSKHIYEKMKLFFSKVEGEFNDCKGKIVCFDPSVNYESKSCLMIKKEPFLDYIKNNKLRIIWTVLGEKLIYQNFSNRDEVYGRLNISGAYFLNENNEIDGSVNLKHLAI
jgi:hypothetical protein